jgi:hypothetical protein
VSAEILKDIEAALDAMPGPTDIAERYMLVSRQRYGQLHTALAHYELWYERLFSPAGLGMLFPSDNLRRRFRCNSVVRAGS